MMVGLVLVLLLLQPLLLLHTAADTAAAAASTSAQAPPRWSSVHHSNQQQQHPHKRARGSWCAPPTLLPTATAWHHSCGPSLNKLAPSPLQLPPRCTQSVSVKPSTSNLSGERSSPAGSTKTGGSKGGPSLLDLLEAGMLQPGTDNMRVTYKGNTYAGGLQSNGTILFNGARRVGGL